MVCNNVIKDASMTRKIKKHKHTHKYQWKSNEVEITSKENQHTRTHKERERNKKGKRECVATQYMGYLDMNRIGNEMKF